MRIEIDYKRAFFFDSFTTNYWKKRYIIFRYQTRDLFAYHAKYFQTFSGEKWRSLAAVSIAC